MDTSSTGNRRYSPGSGICKDLLTRSRYKGVATKRPPSDMMVKAAFFSLGTYNTGITGLAATGEELYRTHALSRA
jgi:hypothetical protein